MSLITTERVSVWTPFSLSHISVYGQLKQGAETWELVVVGR
jgi:hypothetical protein